MVTSTALAKARSTTDRGHATTPGSAVATATPSSGPIHAAFQPACSSISTNGCGSSSAATSGASASVSSTPLTIGSGAAAATAATATGHDSSVESASASACFTARIAFDWS